MPTATTNPDKALSELTTENFRQINQPAEFRKVWRKVQTTDMLRVGDELPDNKNKFEFEWRWIYKKGGTEPVASRIHLVCKSAWRRYAPFFTCKPDQILLDDSQLLACRYPVSRSEEKC